MPPEGVEPLQPNAGEFRYAVEELVPFPPPEQLRLVPPPPAQPPPGSSFPKSPVWDWVEDNRWLPGGAYIANYNLSSRNEHRAELMATSTPPGLQPRLENGVLITDIIPGMCQMKPGLPLAYAVDGDRSRVQTVACLQTLSSLQHYPDFVQVFEALVRFQKLCWGCDEHGQTRRIPRLSCLKGLKLNERSKGRIKKAGDTSGSYSLANTLLKGEGQGTVLPAVQVDTQEGTAQISAVLQGLHELRRLILPKCISKFEYDIGEFHHQINNVVGFGGIEPNGTSTQFNVSCLGDNLLDSIGRQGSWHPDYLDEITLFTTFFLFLAAGPSAFIFPTYFLWLTPRLDYPSC
jgi:hypothetical protein